MEETSTDHQIKWLIKKIDDATECVIPQLNRKLLLHQQDFLRAYKYKMKQIQQLYTELRVKIEKGYIQDKVKERLEMISKQRDYFRLESVKLNDAYRVLGEENRSYKKTIEDLKLQNETYLTMLKANKIRCMSKVVEKAETNNFFSTAGTENYHKKSQAQKQNISIARKPVRNSEKREKPSIRKDPFMDSMSNLNTEVKVDVSHMQNPSVIFSNQNQRQDIMHVFNECLNAVKYEIKKRKDKKECIYADIRSISIDDFKNSDKITVLKLLFSSPQFLEFIQKALFDNTFMLTQPVTDNSAKREKLLKYLKSQGLARPNTSTPVHRATDSFTRSRKHNLPLNPFF